MATLAVKQDGSGDYTTITAAVQAANTSDIIEIQDSETYDEAVVDTSPFAQNLTIRAGSSYSPILDSSNSKAIAIKFYTGYIIEGLEIRNYTGDALDSVSSNRKVIIRDCTIHDVGGHGIDSAKSGSIIERCKIYNMPTANKRGIDGGTQALTIKSCFISGTDGDGIATGGSTTVIEHCTVHQCGGSYGIHAGGSNAHVKFCIVTSGTSAAAGIRATNHSENCSDGNSAASQGNFYDTAGVGDIEHDPHYANSGSNDSDRGGPMQDITLADYSLQVTSPCLGAATGSSSQSPNIKFDITSGSLAWEYTHSVMGIDPGDTSSTRSFGAYQSVWELNDVQSPKLSKVNGVSD